MRQRRRWISRGCISVEQAMRSNVDQETVLPINTKRNLRIPLTFFSVFFFFPALTWWLLHGSDGVFGDNANKQRWRESEKPCTAVMKSVRTTVSVKKPPNFIVAAATMCFTDGMPRRECDLLDALLII